MKNCKLAAIFILMVATSTYSFAQLSVLEKTGEILSGGKDDAEKLLQGYVAPFANAFGTSMSAGWYNTAKVHKLGGFDLTFTFNAAMIPDADKLMDLAELGLSATLPGETMSPTIAGETKSGPLITYDESYTNPFTNSEESVVLAQFEAPAGSGLSFVPTPMLQLGIGLVKGTDVTIRYLPGFDLKGVEMGLWGVGLKHSIKQWIPVLEKLPILQLTGFLGYTKFDMAYREMSFTPANIDPNILDQTSAGFFDGQEIEWTTTGFTGNILVGANLPVVCFYGGLGFASTKTTLDMIGNYPVPTLVTDVNDANVGNVIVTEESSIQGFNLDVENTDGKSAAPRLNIGMRIKLGVITIHGDYTKANYSTVTAGLGISFR